MFYKITDMNSDSNYSSEFDDTIYIKITYESYFRFFNIKIPIKLYKETFNFKSTKYKNYLETDTHNFMYQHCYKKIFGL